MDDPSLRPSHRRILTELSHAERLRRSDLSRRLDLPKATVAGLVEDLITRGLVVESEPSPAGGAGRPPRTLALAGPPPAVGVLVWSTGLLRVAVATLLGDIVAERTAPMTPQQDIDGLLDPGLTMLREAADEAKAPIGGLTRLVLGVPAPYQRGVGMPVRPTGGPTGQYVGWLRDNPGEALSRRSGTATVVENDANLGALGEHAFGAGQGLDSLVYLKLGPRSIGAGLIINGRLHRGANGFAGELAHIQIRDDGVLCACGGRGCLIDEIGPGLTRVLAPAHPEPLTFETMLNLAAEGDVGLRRILGDVGRVIGRPLADLCTLLNPDAIVIDGSIGPAGTYLIDGLAEQVVRYAAPTTAAAVRIVPGALGSQADLLGAVALIRDEQDHRARK
ncbi:ROK family protein [Hamadaea sp. NPDC051192]|uniref:ROK family protein n=1 Tax=Hamadaea sp. NPDC051192 TaxID=3154940 RepID=UPI00341E3DA5